MIDQWGEEVEPGYGEGIDWHMLPLKDRIEDVQQVISGKRSFGRRKNDYINKLYSKYKDYETVANKMQVDMMLGFIPPFKMWPSLGVDIPWQPE